VTTRRFIGHARAVVRDPLIQSDALGGLRKYTLRIANPIARLQETEYGAQKAEEVCFGRRKRTTGGDPNEQNSRKHKCGTK